jgi:hypothetical protein
MTASTSKMSRDVYLRGLRLLWSTTPVDLAFARGQISLDEHQSIVQAIAKKHQVRHHAPLPWVVNDLKGREIAEINQRRDGSFVVRALVEPTPEPVVCTSEEQCYRWIESLTTSIPPDHGTQRG